MPRPILYISHILGWADAYHKRTGSWPNLNCGPIGGTLDETWRRTDSALRIGLRGLPGGSSLARLLCERRGVRNLSCLPRLSIKQILTWVDDHHRLRGTWPISESGSIHGTSGETWKAIDHALRLGMRGLPGGSSLSRLLAERRGVRNIQSLPGLSVEQIVAWADTHRRRTGTWPTSDAGPVTNARGETWSGVNAALQKGRRGFRGGSSLARLLAKERHVRNPKQPARLSVGRILQWADAYQRRHGTWPSRDSGPVAEMDGETWAMIDRALAKQQRGLRHKSSLYRLLKKHRHAMLDGPHRRWSKEDRG
jgi:hypothetical protein